MNNHAARLLFALPLALPFAVALPAQAMSAPEAQHLLLRTGFGATDAQMKALEAQSYDQAVDRLVAQAAGHTVADTPPPDWVNDPLPKFRKLKDASPEDKKAFVQARIRESIELQGWWMREIVDTPEPLTEQMTLFWHNHFTSSLQKDKLPVLLYRQNVMLRHYALGNFRDLLHAVAKDPAMIVYLDNLTNRDQHPNENFARELMELFTLGIGHYSEDDVKAAARAFTGWGVNPRTGEFHEAWLRHDDGTKTFLGHKGDLDGDDVIDIILAQPQTANFIVEKMWRAFVSPAPDPVEVQRLAIQFRENYDIAPLVAGLLKTPQFRNPSDYGTIAKSPVDLVAGTLHSFGVTLDDGRFPAIVCDRLGQALFNPPNVKGWPGGDAWIDSTTLVARDQFLESLSRGFNTNGYGKPDGASMNAMKSQEGMPAPTGPSDGKTSADQATAAMASAATNPQDDSKGGGLRARIVAQLLHSAQSLDMERYLGAFSEQHNLAQAEAVLLPIPPVNPPAADAGAADQLRALLLDPAYQLK